MSELLLDEPLTESRPAPYDAELGEHDAFAALIAPHASKMKRLARRLTRTIEDAEDVHQESLLKAYLKLEQFAGSRHADGGNEFCAWLMRITANTAMDLHRRKQSGRFVSIEDCDRVYQLSFETGAGGWGENPELRYAREERVAKLLDAIEQLPPELQRVCLLRNVMELSTKEAAARMGISTLAVRLKLFRAQGLLRKALGAVSTPAADVRPTTKRPINSYKQRRRRSVSLLLSFAGNTECACGD